MTPKTYNEEGQPCSPHNDYRMERIEFTLNGPPLLIPVRGCVLLVRFKLTGHQDTNCVFCDYAMRSGNSLQLFNCRIKALLFEGTVPCDYALKVGMMTLPADQVVEMFQLRTPTWYHRLEPHALALARRSQNLAAEIGLADLFRAMTGTK